MASHRYPAPAHHRCFATSSGAAWEAAHRVGLAVQDGRQLGLQDPGGLLQILQASPAGSLTAVLLFQQTEVPLLAVPERSEATMTPRPWHRTWIAGARWTCSRRSSASRLDPEAAVWLKDWLLDRIACGRRAVPAPTGPVARVFGPGRDSDL